MHRTHVSGYSSGRTHAALKKEGEKDVSNWVGTGLWEVLGGRRMKALRGGYKLAGVPVGYNSGDNKKCVALFNTRHSNHCYGVVCSVIGVSRSLQLFNEQFFGHVMNMECIGLYRWPT